MALRIMLALAIVVVWTLFGPPTVGQVDICQIDPGHPSCVGGGGRSAECDLSSYDGWTVITDNAGFDVLNSTDPPKCVYIAPKSGAYVVTNPIVISNSLYLHGADKLSTTLHAFDPSQPLFRVVDGSGGAIWINMAGFHFRPTGATYHPTNARAISFENTQPVTLEMLDTMVDRSQIDILGPGSYRFQAVDFSALGMNESLLVVDHSEADVTVVGGGFGGGSQPVAAEFCGGGVAGVCANASKSCQTDADCTDPTWNSCVAGLCARSSGFCITDSGCNTGALERCIAEDQNTCETYHAWQRRGRLRVFGSGLIGVRGDADLRLETGASQGPHVVADCRSEGPKCANLLPATLALVPGAPGGGPSAEPVDLLLMNNEGAWDNPSKCLDFGKARFVDYNAAGTLWMIGNQSEGGAGRLVVGTADPAATVVALGNRYSGNVDDNGVDPLNMLPVQSATTAFAGNLYSRNLFCNWCSDTGACRHCSDTGTVCDSDLDCLGAGNTCDWVDVCADCTPDGNCPDRKTDFVHPAATIDDSDIPRFPATDIPLPMGRPVVSDPTNLGMVQSSDCFLGNCGDHYPDACQLVDRCSDSRSPCQSDPDCPAGESCIQQHTDRCALQATLNKAIMEKRPALIEEGDYIVGKPLYFVHSGQADEDSDFDLVPEDPGKIWSTNKMPGGWIVGHNGNVTIRATGVCEAAGTPCEAPEDCTDDTCRSTDTAFATEGMAYAVVQGITFESQPFVGSCSQAPSTHCFSDDDCAAGGCDASPDGSAVEIENDTTVGFHQSNSTFHDCDFIGGRHALGICIDSGIMCDTNMIAGGSFSDAGLGLGVGGFNALAEIAYDVEFVDNAIAMGHDPEGSVTQGGNWAVLHGSITGTRVKDIEIDSGAGILYFHGLRSDSAVILSETANTGWANSILFENSDLAPGTAGLALEYSHTNGPIFLRSRVEPGDLKLKHSLAVKHLFKLISWIPTWNQVILEADTQKYQWLDTFECPAEIACPPGCGEKRCLVEITGAEACLDDQGGSLEFLECPPGEFHYVEECRCSGGSQCKQQISRKLYCD